MKAVAGVLESLHINCETFLRSQLYIVYALKHMMLCDKHAT